MTLLDSSAVIGFLTDEPSATEVARLLREGQCAMTAVGVAEVVDRLVRGRRRSPLDVVVTLRWLRLLEAAPVDHLIATRAGMFRARHYRRARQVSLADCVLAAMAHERREVLATSDPALLEMCRDEGIPTVTLASSDGTHWEAR